MKRQCHVCGQKNGSCNRYIEEWPRSNDLPELPCV